MKSLIRFFAPLLLCLVLCVCFVPDAHADMYKAAYTETIDWTFDEDGVLTLSGYGPMVYCDVYPWSSIRNSITRVVIGSGITNISWSAFNGCEYMTSVSIPDTVTTISHGAFYLCSSLEEVNIPDSVTLIDDRAFEGCVSMTDVRFGSNVTRIGMDAFKYCRALKEAIIPDSVTSIGGDAFYECHALTNVHLPSDITAIENGCFYMCRNLKSITIPDGVINIGGSAFECCFEVEIFTIPESVKTIGAYAFRGCNSITDIYYGGTPAQWNEISIGIENGELEYNRSKFRFDIPAPDLLLPASVAAIEEEAFAGGMFRYVRLPDHAISIGSGAFADCPNLVYIYIPEGSNISTNAFDGVTCLTILGKNDGSAMTYAENNGFTFFAVDEGG